MNNNTPLSYVYSDLLDLLTVALTNPYQFITELREIFPNKEDQKKFLKILFNQDDLNELYNHGPLHDFLFDQNGLKPKLKQLFHKKRVKLNFASLIYLLSDKIHTPGIIEILQNLFNEGLIDLKHLERKNYNGSLPMIAASKCDVMMLKFLKSHNVNLKYGISSQGNPYSIAEGIRCHTVMDFLKQSGVGPSYSRANGTMVQEVPLLENNVIINPVSRELVRYGHRMEDKFTNLNRQIQTLKEKKINLEESLLKSGLTSKKKNKSQAQNSLSEQIKNLEQSIKSLEKKSKRMKERTNKFLKRSNAQDLMERRYFDELLRRQAYKTRYGRGYSINHGGILQVLRNKFGQYIGPKSGMHHYDERSINGSYFYKTPSNLLIPPAPQPQKLIKNATPKNKNYLKKLQREQRKIN